MLISTWLSDVAFNPWYTPLSAPVFSEAPLLSLSSPFRDEKIDTSGHIDRPIDQDRLVTLIVRQGSLVCSESMISPYKDPDCWHMSTHVFGTTSELSLKDRDVQLLGIIDATDVDDLAVSRRGPDRS